MLLQTSARNHIFLSSVYLPTSLTYCFGSRLSIHLCSHSPAVLYLSSVCMRLFKVCLPSVCKAKIKPSNYLLSLSLLSFPPHYPPPYSPPSLPSSLIPSGSESRDSARAAAARALGTSTIIDKVKVHLARIDHLISPHLI